VKHQFRPAALRGPYDDLPVFELLKVRARECLFWNMSPEYYDNMSHLEHMAWIEAWNEMQDEKKGSA